MPSKLRLAVDPEENASQINPEEPKMSPGDYIRMLLATGTRVAGPWAGTVIGGAAGTLIGPEGTVGGGLLGGAVGGALSEALAEKIEPHPKNSSVNLGRVAVSGALGAVPGSWMVRAGKPLASAGIGAGLGYAGVAGNKLADGEDYSKALDPRQWSKGEVLFGPGAGGLLGGVLGKFSKPKAEVPTPKPEIKLTPEQIQENLEKVGGTRDELGTKVWPAVTKEPPKGAKPGAEQLDQARRDATSVATPVARRVAKAAVGSVKQDLKAAAGDTRPSTTTPATGLLVGPGRVVSGTEEGARFAVADPEASAVVPVAKPGEVVASASPEEASDATLKALQKAQNPRMAQTQLGNAKRQASQGARQEAQADLQDVRTSMGGTDVGTVEKKAAAAQGQALKEKVDVEKAHSQANDVIARSKVAAEKAFNQAMGEKVDVEKAHASANDLLEKEANARAAAIIAGEAKQGLEPQPPSVVERVTSAEGPGKTTVTTRYAPPTPEEGGEGVAIGAAGGPPAKPYTADLVPPQSHVAGTLYTSKDLAKKHADFYGGTPAGIDVVPVGGRKWRVKFPTSQAEPQAEVPAATAEATPELPIDKDAVAFKRYTNKAEANAIAKATGGTVEQYGPRKYKVTFPDQAAKPVDEPITPSPTIELPKPQTKFTPPPMSNEPLPKLDTGGLNIDEYRRMMNLQPTRGVVRTPEELAEYKQLMGKFNQKPPTVEISDYTGAPKVDESIEIPVSGSKAEENPLTVEEFAKALSKEGEKPIADVPFSLDGGKGPAAPEPKQPSILETAAPEAGKKPSTSWGELGVDIDEDEALKKVFSAMGWGEPPKEVKPWGVPDEAAQTASELDSSALTKMKPEDQEKALRDAVTKFKSEKGIGINDLAIRLGLSVAGATAGAAATPDDPLTGAILGGSAGAFAPTVVRALINRASTSNLSESTLAKVAGKVEDATKTFLQMIPDYQRFALLTHPINLPINMWVGPYGSGLMGAIEHTLAGDERGLAALKVLANPINFAKRYKTALNEAHKLIAATEERTEGQLGKAGPEWFKRITSAPGEGMTAGDLAIRDILMESGFTEPEARRITLTSEPYTAWGNAISKFKKGAQTEGGKKSWLVNMMLPFYRTSTNQFEQSVERFPGLGFVAQKYWKDIPDPIKSQFVQQFVGGNVAGASFLLGTVVPEDQKDQPQQAKYVRKFLSDFTGQYGAIAAAAFVAGQAYGAGKSQVGALQKFLVTQGGITMPSTQILETLGSNVRALSDNRPDKLQFPFAVVPGIMDPKVPLSIPSAVGLAASGNQPQGLRLAPPPAPTRSKLRIPRTPPTPSKTK